MFETTTFRPIKKLLMLEHVTEFRLLVRASQALQKYTVVEESYVQCVFPKNEKLDYTGKYIEFRPMESKKFEI